MDHVVGFPRARWDCEQALLQMKEELGLDRFEGHSWRDLHSHAGITMIADTFPQPRRLASARRENGLVTLVGKGREADQ
jgi:SRSO17 transposase